MRTDHYDALPFFWQIRVADKWRAMWLLRFSCRRDGLPLLRRSSPSLLSLTVKITLLLRADEERRRGFLEIQCKITSPWISDLICHGNKILAPLPNKGLLLLPIQR